MTDRERDDGATASRLEDALDEALRDVVSGEGPDDLRRHVMARIALPVKRLPVRVGPALAWAAGLAVVTVSLILFSTRRLMEPRSSTPTARFSAPPSTIAGAAPSDAGRAPRDVALRAARAEPMSGSMAQGAAPRAHEEVRVLPRATATDVEPSGSLVTALPPPEPVEPAPLGSEPLAFRRIVIPGLEVPRLAIEPLEREPS